MILQHAPAPTPANDPTPARPAHPQHRRRGHRRGEPAIPRFAVDLGPRPADVRHDQDPPAHREDVDRQAPPTRARTARRADSEKWPPPGRGADGPVAARSRTGKPGSPRRSRPRPSPRRSAGGCKFAARIARAPRPSRTAGSRGVRLEPFILASVSEPGRPLSRAIAKTRRTAAAWTVRVQTPIARTTSSRSSLPQPDPSASWMIVGHPAAEPGRGRGRPGRGRPGVPRRSARPRPGPPPPGSRGSPGAPVRRGSSVSSASAPAVSKPYITNEGTSAAARNGPR